MAKLSGNDGFWIKPKVIAGFLLVVVFSVVSMIIMYRSFSELNRTREDMNLPNEKLAVINSVVTDMFDAESDIRTFMLTNDEQYLTLYSNKQRKVSRGIETLVGLTSGNAEQHGMVKRIKKLIGNKKLVVDELIAFQSSSISDVFYSRAINEVVDVGNSAAPAVAVLKATTITTHKRDTSFVVADPSTGMFDKIRRFFVGPNVVDTVLTQTSVVMSYDTIHYGKTVPDSVVRQLEHRINAIRVEQSKYFNSLTEKEFLLLESDRKIMEQIRSMITTLEHQELSNALIRSVDMQSIVEGAIIKVLALGAIALIMLLLLLAMIFTDIARGNLYSAQLFEAKQYAENLLVTKELFLANMSHEIRTPLSAVIGMTRQMTKQELPENLKKQVEVMKSASDHLLSVVNDILDYSKLESGQMSLESIKFNPVELVNEVVMAFEPRAQEKKLDFFANIDPNTPTKLWGDTFRLRQMLMNIIGNALKFTDRGSIILSVAPAKVTDDFVKLQITVSDTGIGISEEHQNIIFEDFTQADSGVARKYGGTGLGLTIVKKLVDIQGGELILSSKKNEGTTISIIIPYAAKGEEEQARSKQEFAIPKGVRILIIEDDDVNRLIVTEIAKSIGVEAEAISNPELLLSAVAAGNFNAILTDIQMPGMSGYDIARVVEEQGWNIPVVAITANAMIDSPEHFASQGFSGYLIKPFDEDDLFRVLSPIVGVPVSAPSRPKKSKADKKNKKENTVGGRVDLAEIYRFTGGDKNAIRSILSSFLDNSYLNLDAIGQNIGDRRIKEAAAVAHKMKSAYKQFKIYHIANLLEKIEHLRPDKVRAAQVYYEQLKKQIEPVLKDVQRKLEGLM